MIPTSPVWLVERKTCSEDLSPGSTYWRRLTIDPQVTTYDLALINQGYNVVGTLYDVLRTPELRPKMATPEADRKYTKKTGELYANQRDHDETPEEYGKRCLEEICANPDKYYRRGEVVRLDTDRREGAMDIWHTAMWMKEARRLNIYPRHPGSCVQWSRPCDYLLVCCGEASIHDPVLFEKTETHDLLSQSSIGRFRACPRKYYYYSVLGVQTRNVSETQRRGKSVHGAIEVLCKTGSVDMAIAALDTRDLYKFQRERAMLIGYIARWGMPVGVVAVEQPFDMPLVNPDSGHPSGMTIVGQVDAIVLADSKHLQPVGGRPIEHP